MSIPSVSTPGEIAWNTFSVVSINDVWLTLTLAYKLILQWKIDKLQPESPLARIVPSVERFTASFTELLDCKQNCYFHQR